MIQKTMMAALFGMVASSASAQLVPASMQVDRTGNGVLESGETAVVEPSWRNTGQFSVVADPTILSSFTGPAGPTYTLVDTLGGYGQFAGFETRRCTNCYSIRITAASRPLMHWDATATETVLSTAKVWALHVGGSFADVPASSPFYPFVETLLHRRITNGCTATGYCPLAPTDRAQMAVFLLLAKEGAAYSPPACGAPMFVDVPASSVFCPWIEELARRGIAAGCGGGRYCPASPVTREQMAVFVLRTLDPMLNPPPCGTPMFADVPASSGFCPWIEELARRGIVSGCGGGNYCPFAAVTRQEMGVFLAATFGLTLYGP